MSESRQTFVVPDGREAVHDEDGRATGETRPIRRDPIWAATLTGLVDLRDPDPGKITAEAIAHGLSQINRWAGATQLPIAVASHSVLVRGIFRTVFPTLATSGSIHALLHDAHEYILGDIIAPAEALLAADIPGFKRVLAGHKTRLDIAIRTAFGLRSPSIDILAAVHEADLLAADLEWKLWMPPENGPSPFGHVFARHPGHGHRLIRPVPADRAADAFRQALESDLAQLRSAA